MNNTPEFPILGDVVFASTEGATKIYAAKYGGEDCYCIKHEETGYLVLFDYREDILKQITAKVNRGCNIVLDGKKAYTVIKFSRNGKEKSISIRSYLFAKYNGLGLEKVRGHKIMLESRSLLDYNISDFRESNLYDAGGFRPERNGKAVYDVQNPGTKERCIVVTVPHSGGISTEIYEYSEELYQMLCTSNLCGLSVTPHSGRIQVIVHYGHSKTTYKRLNLSRFVMTYYSHFGQYRSRKGAVKRFVHDILKLAPGEDIHSAHINSEKWNGNSYNLCWSSKEDNQDSRETLKYFVGEYGAFAIRYGDSILVEFTSHGNKHYYKCDSPVVFSDMVQVLSGRCDLTKKLKVSHVSADGFEQILTPKEELERVGKAAQAENLISEYWTWCKRRDSLISLYEESPDTFKPWLISTKGIPADNTEALSSLIEVLAPSLGQIISIKK